MVSQIGLFAIESLLLFTLSLPYAISDKKHSYFPVLWLLPTAISLGAFAFFTQTWFGGINTYSILSNMLLMAIFFSVKNLSLGDKGFLIISLIAIPSLIVGFAVLFAYLFKPKGKVPFMPLFNQSSLAIFLLFFIAFLTISIALQVQAQFCNATITTNCIPENVVVNVTNIAPLR